MPFTVPPNIPYAQPIVARPAALLNDPIEGNQFVPLEFDWNGTTTCYSVNIGQQSVSPFSQICALIIDNTACGSDVQFIFPDSQEVITCPGSGQLTICVVTQQTSFFVNAANSKSTDVTSVKVLNFSPYTSLYVPPDTEVNASGGFGYAPANAAGTVEIALPAPAILKGISMAASIVNGATAGSCIVSLQDIAGKNLAQQHINLAASAQLNALLLNDFPNDVPIAAGINIIVASVTGGMATATGGFSVNVSVDIG